MAETSGKRENTGADGRSPRTALGEVPHEFENAATDVDDARERRHRGEAGEAIPGTRAQEESERD